VYYLVGSRGRLTQLEKAFLTKPWEDVRESVQVKLIEHVEETLFSLAARAGATRSIDAPAPVGKTGQASARTATTRPDARRTIAQLGAAKKEAGKAYTLLVIHTPTKDQPVTSETFHFALNRKKLRQARRREGSYLLRSNLKSMIPAICGALSAIGRGRASVQGVEERSVDPSIYHQLETRIEAHIFIAFLAYCLLVTLKQRLKTLAPGLTPGPCSKNSPR